MPVFGLINVMADLPAPYYFDKDEKTMSFGIYLTGCAVVIAGLIYGASLMHMPTQWIVVSGLVLVGLGILMGVKVTRQKDSAT